MPTTWVVGCAEKRVSTMDVRSTSNLLHPLSTADCHDLSRDNVATMQSTWHDISYLITNDSYGPMLDRASSHKPSMHLLTLYSDSAPHGSLPLPRVRWGPLGLGYGLFFPVPRNPRVVSHLPRGVARSPMATSEMVGWLQVEMLWKSIVSESVFVLLDQSTVLPHR